MHTAAKDGNEFTMKEFHKLGADINIKDNDGVSTARKRSENVAMSCFNSPVHSTRSPQVMDTLLWGESVDSQRCSLQKDSTILYIDCTRVSDQLSDGLVFRHLFQANEKFSTFQSCGNL